MRDILFRGKRVDNGSWVYGYFVKSDGKINSGKCYILSTVADFSYGDNGNRIRIGCFVEVLPDTVGQYTDLKDKNGNRVYENDILSHVDTRRNDYDTYCVVKYGDFNCTCCDGVYGWYFDGGDIRCVREYTVVGNITDNAELVQKEKLFDTKEKQLTEEEEISIAETYMQAFVDAVKPEKNKGGG